MTHTVSNLIAQARSQFSDQAHYVLGVSHGHHFDVAPKRQRQAPQQRSQQRPQQEEEASPPPRKRAARQQQMMEVDTPPDPDELMAQKQQKIAAHNARINALNNSKAKAPEEAAQEPVPK